MKKKILIIVLMVFLVIIGVVVVNKFLLNKNEKEILSVLKDLDYSLKNPPNTEDDTISLRPTEPTSLKEYIHTILEVRKTYNENGNLTFLFKVVLEENYETILVVSNGNLQSMIINTETLVNNDSATDTESEENWGDSLTKIFMQSFITKTNELITENWNNAMVVEKINFTKVLNKI